MNLTSEQWLALGKLLHGQWLKLPGDAEYKIYEDDRKMFRFYCEACDHDFESIVTPQYCPLCRACVDTQTQANSVTHVGTGGGVHVAKTFPFYCPDNLPESPRS